MKIIALILIGGFAVASFSSFAMSPSGDTQGNPLWLSHFVGKEVIVTFIAAPPDMGRTVKALLMDADYPGIVLKISGSEIFFSYANIISVEPVP